MNEVRRVMTKQVVVSSAQKAAARAMVRRLESTGRDVSPSLRKIANARIVVTETHAS